MQVTIRRFPCARVRAFVHVERVFEAACGIGDDLVEPVLLAEVCQREAVCLRNCTPLDHQFGLALTTDCVQLDQGVSLSRPSENGQKRTPPTRWKKKLSVAFR